jgi:enoyl-CoA hydratase/carnithine racemase
MISRFAVPLGELPGRPRVRSVPRRATVNPGDVRRHSGRPDWFEVGRSGEWRSPEFESVLDVFHRLEEIPQPTIAAIDGLAAGGGSEIALACTLRVGSPRARLQQSEILAGVIPGGGGTVRLPRLVGPAVAAEVILSGRVFQAEEALRVGWRSRRARARDLPSPHGDHWPRRR